MKFSIKDFFSKYDQILKKSLMENFFCAVYIIICLIYFGFIECLLYAFVLAAIRREFPCDKLTYKLKLRMT